MAARAGSHRSGRSPLTEYQLRILASVRKTMESDPILQVQGRYFEIEDEDLRAHLSEIQDLVHRGLFLRYRVPVHGAKGTWEIDTQHGFVVSHDGWKVAGEIIRLEA